MDATREAVEREMKKLRDLVDMTNEEVEEQKDAIRQKIAGDFRAVDVMNNVELLRQKQNAATLFFFAWRTLENILKSTQPPAVEGES